MSNAATVIEATAAAIAGSYAVGSFLYRRGQRDQKLDDAIARLVDITDRHDDEIRELKSAIPSKRDFPPPRRARNGAPA